MSSNAILASVIGVLLGACVSVKPASEPTASPQPAALGKAASLPAAEASLPASEEAEEASQELVISQAATLQQAERQDEEQFKAELRFADHAEREAVQYWINYFTNTDRERFARFLERGLPYKALVETILQKEGVPTYFYYLAMIESGFQVRATSHAQAVGMWQFIRATGQRYGLQVNRYVDERQDPIRATIAAAHYLRDLHNVFDSWFLAMAAYNAGESRIVNTIMRHGTRDFWQLSHNKALPPETRQYVPKFIAAALIGSAPQQYGFTLPQHTAPLPRLFATPVPSPVSLNAVAAALKIPLATLRLYNPNLLAQTTPPDQRSYRLWLPGEAKPQLAALSRLRTLPRQSLQAASSPASYRVRRGDTLAAIAKRHGTSVASLASVNRLRNHRIHPGMQLKLPTTNRATGQYRVRNGDSLSEISKRFGLSVVKLKKLNGLRHTRIYAGQVLNLGDKRS